MKVPIEISENASVTEILEAIFKATEYDGLVNVHMDCGCPADEIAPCDWCGDMKSCQLAYSRDPKFASEDDEYPNEEYFTLNRDKRKDDKQ